MKRRYRSERIFDTLNSLLIGAFILSILYPLIYIVSASFSSGSAVMSNRVWLWPVEFNWEGYRAVFNHRLILNK